MKRTNASDDPLAGDTKVSASDRKPQHPGEFPAELAPGLYVTATPIGHARDVTLRALDVLRGADLIAAEDTRVTAKLLALYGIARPLRPYNDHNAAHERPGLLARLKDGARVALVSDAGTPLVSDPGFKLVRAALAQGIAVYPVPGASALLAGLTLSGLPTDRFLFAGFLSARAGARDAQLAVLRTVPATLIFFESAQRLAETLARMEALLGPREAAVTRELTKRHEEARRGSLAALAAHYAQAGPPRGEVTLLVGPPAAGADTPDIARVDAGLDAALAFMPLKAASEMIAALTGLPRKTVYARGLARKHGPA